MRSIGAALVAAFFMYGCTIIGPHKTSPEGWPQLTQYWYKSSWWGVQRYCSPMPLVVIVSACAVINLCEKTCTVYTATDDPNVLEHEEARCEGRDHIGGSAIRDTFEAWKANGSPHGKIIDGECVNDRAASLVP